MQGSLIALVSDRDMARLIACRVNDRDVARRITSHKNMIKLQGSAAPALGSTSGTEGLGSAAPALVSTSDTEMDEGHNALPLPVVATASPYALLQGQHLAPAVQAAPSSSLVLPPGCFAVSCRNASMYGKKMRDVHMAGFRVQSDAVIRFRRIDGKVAVADLLVGVGKYVTVSKSQETIFKYLQSKDDRIRDLDIEVDEKLSDEVGRSNLMMFLCWYKIIFNFFVPDPIWDLPPPPRRRIVVRLGPVRL